MKEAIFKFAEVEDLLVSFSTEGPCSDRDWAELITHLKNPQIRKYMCTNWGATEANSLQRKSASEVLNARKIPVVVIANANIVRGIVTAVSWLGVNIKAFDWPALQKGWDHLRVTGSQQTRATEIIQRLKATHVR